MEKEREQREYLQEIVTLDMETTSLVRLNEGWEKYDSKKHEGQDYQRGGCMYAWGSYLGGQYFYGRTLEQLAEYFAEISHPTLVRIVWVQNLAFEFQFLRNIIPDFEVFARKPRKMIKAYTETYNLEFRCTLCLSGYPLEKIAEIYSPLEHQKAIGQLDYKQLRHSKTPLTESEWEYLRIDNVIIVDYITNLLEKYYRLEWIPLTNTGILRKELKKRYKEDYSVQLKMKRITNTNLNIFRKLGKAFQGGYTHANAVHVGKILEGVSSWDIVSSYPTDMLLERFPMGKFTPCEVSPEMLNRTRNTCHLLTLKYSKIEAKGHNSYISYSKCNKKETKVTVMQDSPKDLPKEIGFDNGRVSEAETLVITCTDIDFFIIKKNYTYESVEILESWQAPTGYLPDIFCHYILELFYKKQTLKGVPGKEEEYDNTKARLNSLYGMLVTNTITDEVMFDSDWWVRPVGDKEAQEKLIDQTSRPYKISGVYAWGVWVTAYARRKLWHLINQIDYWLVYADTDSLKFMGDFTKEIEKYNSKIAEKREDMCFRLGIDPSSVGNIGEFERENDDKPYDRFITWGAKKYAVEMDGKIKITVAGVPKKKGAECLTSLEEFAPGFIFGEKSGKLELCYCDEQEEIRFTDYLGNPGFENQRYAISLNPTTYKLSITDEFSEFVQRANSRESIPWHGFYDDGDILSDFWLKEMD